jgi:hypothetical protein
MLCADIDNDQDNDDSWLYHSGVWEIQHVNALNDCCCMLFQELRFD